MSPKSLVAGLAAWAFCALAQAQSFDFESGSLAPWTFSTTGGTCAYGVVPTNGSQMAHVRATYGAVCTLSLDFTYDPGAGFAFDMMAVAVPSSPYQAEAGVKFTLLNAFNVAVGSAGLYNTTTATFLGAHDSAIDQAQHHYAGTLGDLAGLAGISPATPISHVNFAFTTYAAGFAGTAAADVWFDNVVVAVPEPAGLQLMSLGTLVAFVAARRSRRRA